MIANDKSDKNKMKLTTGYTLSIVSVCIQRILESILDNVEALRAVLKLQFGKN